MIYHCGIFECVDFIFDDPVCDAKIKPQFKDCYELGAQLGKGGFSEVKEARRLLSNEEYAIKIVSKKGLTETEKCWLQDEVKILKMLNHKYITALHDVFDEKESFYFVMEKMRGGDLFERIVKKTFYSESEARDTLKAILEGVGYFHGKNIAHRDLKPDNLLLVSTASNTKIKIADFGFAKYSSNDECLRTQCGTPGHVAPEIIVGVPYGTKCDMFSVGVIAFILMGGYPPFMAENQSVLLRMICRGQYQFHEKFWAPISQSAKDLINVLLMLDPQKRISAKDALERVVLKR